LIKTASMHHQYINKREKVLYTKEDFSRYYNHLLSYTHDPR
jgi:hypothetical protein